MLIQHVRLHALDRCSRDDLKIRILRFDRLVELRVAAVVRARTVELVLVAHLDVLQRERSRVPVLGALCAPFGVDASGYIFNLIQRVLHVRLKRRSWVHMLLCQRVAGIHSEHGLHLQILTPLEEFEQPHAV